MSTMLPNRYNFRDVEPRLALAWASDNLYAFDPDGIGPIYTIDTPPPTVSGELHIGHCFSYTQADVIARFHRMRGERVFYPMGFDDNGLPTERLVEKTLRRKATEMERAEFLAHCHKLIQQTEDRFEALWRRLSLSVDWRYRYSTISPLAQRTAQLSFIRLYEDGHAYAQSAPTLWCPECQTAIAQAELEDKLLPTLFTTFTFTLTDGTELPIATTRPELLPACVAIFVHPDDARYQYAIGQQAQLASAAFTASEMLTVPVLADALVDPAKGSGAVMCCTFGDSTDIRWYHTHQLPLREAIGRDGRMTALAGPLAGLQSTEARQRILQHLRERGKIMRQETIEHTIGVHERCGTPVEYRHARQWFIRVLDQKERLLAAGRQIEWRPEYMRTRYEHWVENLQWDWCISRQRFLGVPFPAWTCRACGEVMLARVDELPIDPRFQQPGRPCRCGATDFAPEMDVMDTWMTSSCSPQIIGRWADDPDWFAQHFPADIRPQAHDIIRTWTFYSIVKSLYHCNTVPWRKLLIAGHALANGQQKISKSKQNSAIQPLRIIEQESADALRYWATSVKIGNDTPFSPEQLANGRRLVTKLWQASRFVESRLQDLDHATLTQLPIALLPTDRWLLSRLARILTNATEALTHEDITTARQEVERFFWSDFCDNYLELVKGRLYQEELTPERHAAQWTLYHVLLAILKLLAPYLPFVTEELYRHLFAQWEGYSSIHIAPWPAAPAAWLDERAGAVGKTMLAILGYVRRYKAEHGLSLGSSLQQIQIMAASADEMQLLEAAACDLRSATRAQNLSFAIKQQPILAPALIDRCD